MNIRAPLLFLFALLTVSGIAIAQGIDPAAVPAASAPAAETITLTQLSEQAVSAEKLAEQMKQLSIHPAVMDEVKTRLQQQREQSRSMRKESGVLLDDSQASVEQLRTSQSQWQFYSEQWRADQQLLKQRAAELENGLSQVTQAEEGWKQIRTQLEGSGWQADGQRLAQQALNLLGGARKALTESLQEILAHSKQWQDLLDTADEHQLLLKQHENQLRKQLLTSLQAPLWQLRADDFQITEGTEQALLRQLALNGHYLLHHASRGVMILAATLVMLVFLWRLRVRRRQLEVMQETSLHLHMPLIDRPFSATVATSVALALLIYPKPPQLLHSTLSLLLFIPIVRLGLSRLPVSVRPLAWLISLFFAINNLSVLSEAIPALQRLWMVCCAAASVGVCIYALRKLSRANERNTLFWRSVRAALWLSLISAVIAMIGGTAGAATLAQFLIIGVANAAYGALCMAVVATILADLATAVLYLPSMNGSQLVLRHRPLLIARARQLAALICAFAWVRFTLGQFLLDEPVLQWTTHFLTEKFTVGNLAVSLGDVLAVLITVWLSFKLSQLLRFIFIEDIAPRAKLSRGVPDAISTLMHYAVLLTGFMLAIGAAGIDLSKLAIMAGALGVGIGIGLQDVVNNFTSGLILLFEQNIKQGDIIQCSTVNGRVINIGLRSSVVRTFDGAEVIVPNSQLVSAQVINWTHSDQQRRITIPVSVAYDSDPALVIATLLAVARDDSDILCDPEPSAFFFRFGANGLEFELRAWVASGETLNDVNSRLCMDIASRFKAQGIEIPYPQQDIHVRSWPTGTSG